VSTDVGAVEHMALTAGTPFVIFPAPMPDTTRALGEAV
jgi:hypothetical protein